ncbi:MAG: LysR family transcriptional regulator [Candidatus Ornithomonoglobus sp.]
MTLQQLRYIITITEKGSISEAAKSLFISQPSLSNAVKELEKELNITIFTRTNKGIALSQHGEEFLGYARQVIEQTELLEEHFLNTKQRKQKFSVSTQHYSFAVNAFVDLIEVYGTEEYDFTLRETRTHEIIEDVKQMRSEIGILYLNEFNEKVLNKLISENELEFHELFTAKPHIFISSKNPLADKEIVTLADLEPYPFLSFEQGEYNSFYFSEEILSTVQRRKNIKVSDRATLFNLLIGLNGYTICTGIIDEELNGKNIISLPLDVKEKMRVGYIKNKNIVQSRLGEIYINSLKEHILV